MMNKKLNHEAHEGGDGKWNEVFILLIFFVFNHETHVVRNLHGASRRHKVIINFLLLNLRVLRALRGKKLFRS